MGTAQETPEAERRRRRVVTLLVFLAIILALIYAFRAVLVPFLIAIFFAYLIDPLINRLSKVRIFNNVHFGRAGAILSLYSVILVGIYFAGAFAIPALGRQLQQVRHDLPYFQGKVEQKATALIEWWNEVVGSATDKEGPPTRKAADPQATRQVERNLPEPRTRFHLKGGGQKTGKVITRRDKRVFLEIGDGVEAIETASIVLEEPLPRIKVKHNYGRKEGEEPIELAGEVISRRGDTLTLDIGARTITIPEGSILEEERLTQGAEAAALDVKQIIAEGFDEFVANIDRILLFAFKVAKWILGAVWLIFLILMITAFLVVDRQKIIGFLRSVPPDRYRAKYVRLTEYINSGLAGVIRGQLGIMAVNGMLTWIGLEIIGLRYALLLGVIAGIMSLIPIFGTILSTGPIVLIALGTSGWYLALMALGWVLFIHFLEGNFLNPKIMGSASKIHPVVVIFALLAGHHSYGVVGALLAVPAASIVQSTFKFFVIDRQAEFEEEPLISAT